MPVPVPSAVTERTLDPGSLSPQVPVREGEVWEVMEQLDAFPGVSLGLITETTSGMCRGSVTCTRALVSRVVSVYEFVSGPGAEEFLAVFRRDRENEMMRRGLVFVRFKHEWDVPAYDRGPLRRGLRALGFVPA